MEANINELREQQQVEWKIIGWLDEMEIVNTHEEHGNIYRGRVLAQDEHGIFEAVIGTTDYLRKVFDNGDGQYKILEVIEEESH